MTGIVYALTNEAIPGLVKIGRTSRAVEQRVRELFTTGVPMPFEIGCAFRVQDDALVERSLHRAFAPNRHGENREFFAVEVYQVHAILRLLGDDVTSAAVEEPATVIPEENITRAPRPRADYLVMGLEPGDTIVSRDDRARAKIANAREVEFEGRPMSLTQATRLAFNNPNDAFRKWKFGGETLQAIYDRTYPRVVR